MCIRDSANLIRRINKIEKNTELYLDDMQKTAVMEAVRHGLMILTGGPGTGKTTTINAMIHFFESEGLDIYPVSYTHLIQKVFRIYWDMPRKSYQ